MPPSIKKLIEKFKSENALNMVNITKDQLLLFNSYLLALSARSSQSEKIIAENNFIVNAVTSLEKHFKKIIIEKKGWDEEGLDLLLKEKITLGEAYTMFSKEKLTREFIITNYYSFSNFQNINNVFSKLIKRDFYDELENHNLKSLNDPTANLSLLKSQKDWRKCLSKLFEIRNDFIHEGVPSSFKEGELNRYFVIVMLMEVISKDYFIHN